ncbi:F-box/LRR-repeat protein 25-like isoform X2 [Silene latifolia]|uniref:F-box/LRR-repeat protein 25-like isoform X2 n=1 Tax=Silene latifolia TaxID=37657 RepID=UPI003D76EC78
MNPDCEETVSGQLNTVDRFSDLPDFIVHHIISFLDTREAYRTCILSKRWAHISATNPIIVFHFYCKKENSSASCLRLTTIRVLSIRLKVINLDACGGLVDVMVDAPSLTKFIYRGTFGLYPAITISSQASCDISVRTRPNYLDTQGFCKLQKLMTGLRSCHVVEISLTNSLYQSVCDNIKFNEEELGDVNLGPPCDITELKLTLYHLKLSRSSVSAFLNGIFWTCRPDIISFRFHLNDPDLMIQVNFEICDSAHQLFDEIPQ